MLEGDPQVTTRKQGSALQFSVQSRLSGLLLVKHTIVG